MNESKSQLTWTPSKIETVVTNIRISMNESKSQQLHAQLNDCIGCYKYQNINERKQITTYIRKIVLGVLLLQISEYQ